MTATTSAIRRRAGLTLIELAVVIAIIGILIALSIPAVQMARSSARKAACENNLRQVGVAIANYAAAIQIFPQGANGSGYSVHAMLLPYLDQAALFQACNFSARVFALSTPAGNDTVAFTQLSVFLCPADSPPPGGSFGSTSYAGNRGSGVQSYGYNGAFAIEWDGPIGYASFTDGTSQTAAMSEWVLGPAARDVRDRARSTFETPRALTGRDELDAFADACRSIDVGSARLNRLSKGRNWLRGELSFTLYTHVLAVNEPTCTNGSAVQEGAWTAGSLHSGGANVLFVDGSVRFIRTGVDIETWRALGSRNGGEVIAPGGF